MQLFGGIFPHVDGITIDDGDHFTGVGGAGAVADGGADEDEEGEGDGYQNGWFVVHGVLLSENREWGRGVRRVYIKEESWIVAHFVHEQNGECNIYKGRKLNNMLVSVHLDEGEYSAYI